MNAMRVTYYPPTAQGTPQSYEPFTIVILERDLRDEISLEEAAMRSVETSDAEGVFCVTEVFDVPDDATMKQASKIAVERMPLETQFTERTMACLYQYEAQALAVAQETATLMATIPAPLSAEDTARALRRLAKHPDYRSQRVIFPTQDGYVVSLDNTGEIVTEPLR